MQVPNKSFWPKIEEHSSLGKPTLTIMKELSCCSSNVRHCLNLLHATALNRLKTNFYSDKSFQPTRFSITGIDNVIVESHIRPPQTTRLSTRCCFINELRLKLFSLATKVPLNTRKPLCSSRCLNRTNNHNSKHKPCCKTEHNDKK